MSSSRPHTRPRHHQNSQSRSTHLDHASNRVTRKQRIYHPATVGAVPSGLVARQTPRALRNRRTQVRQMETPLCSPPLSRRRRWPTRYRTTRQGWAPRALHNYRTRPYVITVCMVLDQAARCSSCLDAPRGPASKKTTADRQNQSLRRRREAWLPLVGAVCSEPSAQAALRW